MPAPFTVKAIFDYTSDHEDDLTFSIGQVIKVTAEEDEEWYYGEYTDELGTKKEGIFPRNFVERYEPPAPPRPSRPNRVKKEPETVSRGESVPQSLQPVNNPAPTSPEFEDPARNSRDGELKSRQPLPPPTVDTPPTAVSHQQPPQPPVIAAPRTESKPPPPPVAEKPGGASFRDRIAAFNKPAAAPITPFNPAGSNLNTNAFIKKPFVAPPPSKNAYIPMPVEAPPQKVYRREEDPEIVERDPERLPGDRSLPPPAPAVPQVGDNDDQPKPTSLKERIALLQKQQLEQAARHAEAAQRKEKPKKPPPKKRVEPQEPTDNPDAVQDADLERTGTIETTKESHPAGDYHGEHGPQQHRIAVAPRVMSPPQPSRELTSDTNDADYSGTGDTEEAEETSTSKEDVDDKPAKQGLTKGEGLLQGAQEGNEEAEEEQEEEEEEIDPEIKRRMELRDRMAKMSGGMGMMGMFGPPPGMPGISSGGYKKPKPPPSADSETKSPEEEAQATHASPVPIMVLPGMQARKQESIKSPIETKGEETESQLATATQSPKVPMEESDVQDALAHPKIDRVPPPPPSEESPPAHLPSHSRSVPPPVPGDRPLVPSAPLESHPTPMPPLRTMSPSVGEESDDELSATTGAVQMESQSSDSCPTAVFSDHKDDTAEPLKSPTATTEKRLSYPPPVPHASPIMPPAAQSRPPPPPPPVSRKSTSDSRMSTQTQTGLSGHDTEGEITEYEGDYDTDIASGAKHKDALKAHGRDSSLDEGTITDEYTAQSPRSPHDVRPPPLPTMAPRAAPPPPPAQPPKSVRQSVDMPRLPPPPIPPPKDEVANDDEYDPYRYDAHSTVPRTRSPPTTKVKTAPEEASEDFYPESPPRRSVHLPPLPTSERTTAQPPPPPSQPPPLGARSQPPRQSADLLRNQSNTRRSMDIPRPSVEGYIASDVDLGESTFWWTQPSTPPPVFQNRRDILYEIEESSSKRGGKTTISKEAYILFMDYSQTIISVQFDSKNPGDIVLEQRHEAPPPRLRQDQLENSHAQFGTRLAEAVAAKQNTTVGDGTPHALVQTLLAPLADALLPVGVRAYGAVVYSNLANASVQQYDEIRAGDIVTFRNARFQGHRGTMHQKYNVEVGKPDHVGIVVDWDGTKKKIRAWEQGRESKKVKIESFKLGDLKSGECRVWRVMPRSWVGWDGEQKS
ncbi:assembly of actin patch protein [Emydomyces testavorans]|uniref:Assembly of actin patch protein n=1 Tax=Emydomyces testavorans TaxID=2070801 RepID=A0AAF0IJP8_9EURO|nr:assembly of actin patch protein [Emydomyces testavorans]